MNRINFIFISEEIAIKPGDIKPEDITPEMVSQLSALEGILSDNPQLANDPEIQKLISIKSDMEKAFPTQVPAQQQQQAPAAEQTPATPAANADVNPLESLPFFGGKGATQTDFKGAKPEQLSDVATKLGFDTKQEGWFENFVNDFATSKQEVAKAATIKTEFEQLTQSINALPKEVQEILRAVAEGKDWKTSLGGATSLDFSKDFSKLPDADKVAIHNYFFPDDKIEAGADVSDKTIAKSIKAAQSKFDAEKSLYSNQKDAERIRIDNSNKAWVDSINTSKSDFLTKFPQFKQDQVAEIEDVIKTKGIASLFVDKQGQLTKEGFERIAFAMTGADVLKAAVALAKNKGFSEGKAEVLQTTQTDGNKGGGGQSQVLTDEEKAAMKLLAESQVSTSLTY